MMGIGKKLLIANKRNVLRHDFHIHSLQSSCGMHSILEILQIAANKGVETVNISDHGNALGRQMNFGVITDLKRTPRRIIIPINFFKRVKIRLLAGIESNIGDEGETDLPVNKKNKPIHNFSLISAGFHSNAKLLKSQRNAQNNFNALSKYVEKFPLDILTHPCIKSFPLPIKDLVQLAKEYNFYLEVNNTNLVVGKTNCKMLMKMIEESLSHGVTLICNSDGHTWHELFECGAVRNIVEGNMKLMMEDIFPLNFDNWEKVSQSFPNLQ